MFSLSKLLVLTGYSVRASSCVIDIGLFKSYTCPCSSIHTSKLRTELQSPLRVNMAVIDVLTASGEDLQALLKEGKTTSMELIDLYLDQIKKHNHHGLELNAMISVAPRSYLISIAKQLDEERAAGRIRGPLHGLPITVKDNICTDKSLGMDTTCGAFALVGAEPKGNAPIIERLIDAGLIIIGKANLSEMAGWKGFGITTGWSAVGGQTQSPYIIGGVAKGEKLLGHTTPAGSSSGSAVSVAAGFAPLSVATETDGSISQPANRAALYGLKLTVGSVPTDGTAPWSALTDSVGGMAKTAQDLAYLVESLATGVELFTSLNKTKLWTEQTVGFVDDKLWEFVDFICTADPVLIAQQQELYKETKSILKQHGAKVHENVPLTSMNELQLDNEDALDQLWNHDFAKAWEGFLNFFQESKVKTITDIVEFNKQNAEKALPPEHPGQQLLEATLEDKMSADKYSEGVEIIRTAAKKNGIDRTLTEFGLDVIVGPMDGRIPTIAAAAGCPVGTVPLGYSKTNGRPFGLAVVAAAGDDQKILNFMAAWDETMPKRKPPPQLVDWDESKERLSKV
ncbi:amidase signature domain-containing protein [Bisporella sp. PMI_857]|nr:amidase signature domain-containing protein [Bisporella sp. PMI_857]